MAACAWRDDWRKWPMDDWSTSCQKAHSPPVSETPIASREKALALAPVAPGGWGVGSLKNFGESQRGIWQNGGSAAFLSCSRILQ
jgi:hypothetical protein